ncbi:hypothetical protein P8452_40282 [Trifolium repens]|nr:hypothetical protein P8452_40282 [Trifolium repens]
MSTLTERWMKKAKKLKSGLNAAGLTGWDSRVTRPVHKLVEDIEMGRELVRQECVNDLGRKCSRLWKHEEIYEVLTDKKGTDAIQCIFLDICRIEKVQLHAKTFKKMHNLRMMLFYKSYGFSKDSNVILSSLLNSLPHHLKFLRWDGFPQESLPLGFRPKNLVKLYMPHSRLEQLWLEDKDLPNMKTLDLSGSQNLIQIPDLARCPNIEEVILSHCRMLGQVYSSSFLCELKCLWLNGCISLRSLHIPSSILQRTSGLIVVYGCSSLEMFSVDLSFCESFLSLPTEIFKLKFLKRLYLRGCYNLEKFGEINETIESLLVLILDQTAIKELPSSLHHLVGLEELSLRYCQKLEIIPSSIGSLGKLSKLDLTFCESLETFPSTIFKLKLTKLDLHGCSMLKTFPEILEPAETFAHINLTKTAVKELPSSLEYLVGLQTLCLKLCSDLVSLPNSIVNLNFLSELDCSGCRSLTEIPNNIGSLSLLRELSLQESNIVSLPESITHLSSLKSLDLSDCKKLECIPQLPPSLNQLLAYDCPSVGRMMPNSRLELPSISNKDTFEFHFTNSQQLDETARSNIGAEARLRITENAYRSVFFCFPGSTVPHWFPCHCKGRLVTMKKDSLDWPSDNRLVGFALSVVLGHIDMDDDIIPIRSSFRYRLTFESDGCTHILPNNDKIKYYFYLKGRSRSVVQDHTFIWKYHLDLASIDNMLSDAHNFTFEFSEHDYLILKIKCHGERVWNMSSLYKRKV